mmetsp:Transcript_11650/g.22426  ORF Transcript_11650/g.22426 Transcript_11650/m.22426 type:complete len:86 (-) Transcript_11650:379-636(-)
MLLVRMDANDDGKIAPDEFVDGFHEVLTIRHHQLAVDASGPVPSEATHVPPRTFGGSWCQLETWARDDGDSFENESKAKAKAATA